MAKSNSKDMTQGSPMKLIAAFFLPLMLGMLFQQFYSMMDTIIVGKFLGVNALAAVGSTGSINFMVIGFCMGICNRIGKIASPTRTLDTRQLLLYNSFPRPYVIE